MPTIQELYGLNPPKPYTTAKKLMDSLKLEHVVKSKELIGIEVEIENTQVANAAPISSGWQTHNDGSLRNNGMEFVTLPIPAEYAPAMLHNLLHQYLSHDCCFSPRTSVHIHLNVQDLTPEKVIDLVLLYVVYEKLFYRFTGRGRQKNIYCVPLVDTNLLNQFATKRLDRNGWSKYTGLNLLPLQNYGTVEFRHMHGTNDIKKLTEWINLITSLKEYVLAQDTAFIRKTIAVMDDGYDYVGYMDHIFGPYATLLPYHGVADVNYLQAKQALATETGTNVLYKKRATDSAYYQFK
jgi:hypothetical protein